MMILMAMSLAAVQAEQPPRAPHGRVGPSRGTPAGFGGGGMDRFFDMADTDRDGKLSRAEVASARSRFREMRQEHMARRMHRMGTASAR